MKKLSAILFSAVFLFNLFGYRLVFNFVQQQSDRQLVAALDNDNYNEADLLTLKMPISLPYVDDQEDFERVDGELTVDGKIYKYVKRKISGGNLILLCLPDHKKMQIESSKDDYYKYSNDLKQNEHSKKSDHSKEIGFKKLLSDYDSTNNEFAAIEHPQQLLYGMAKQNTGLSSFPHITPEQPPEFC